MMETDIIFQHLQETARKLLAKTDGINNVLNRVRKSELSIFTQQSAADFEKIKTATNTFKDAVNLFITTDLPALQNDSSDLTEKLKTIRHDLRTPVNAMKGYSEIIVEDLEGSQLIEIAIKIAPIPGMCSMLLNLINDIRDDVALHENGTLAVNQPEPIFLSSMGTTNPVDTTSKDVKSKRKISTRTGSLLIVDDIQENRDLLTDWLQRKHFETAAVASGQEALSYLEEHPETDIVLLDVMMPGMDGYEVLNRIKSNPKTEDTIVIMISALDEMDSIVRCIKNGAEDYLVKPFNSYLLDARISTCLEKKRLRDGEKAYIAALQEEFSIAQKIQLSMLPVRIPRSNDYSIYGRSVPAKEVGGDFYDWYELGEGKLGFCIGDVSGKGISAALFMAVTRTVLNTLVSTQPPASQSMTQANEALRKNNDAMMFVTLFYGIFDTNTNVLSYVNAGHWQPIVVSKDGSQRVLEGSSGPALGVVENISYREFSTTLEPGDLILLFTDGVTEAINPSYEAFGMDRLKNSLSSCRHKTPQKLVEKIIHDIMSYSTGEDIFDDITCLALCISEKKQETKLE